MQYNVYSKIYKQYLFIISNNDCITSDNLSFLVSYLAAIRIGKYLVQIIGLVVMEHNQYIWLCLQYHSRQTNTYFLLSAAGSFTSFCILQKHRVKINIFKKQTAMDKKDNCHDQVKLQP